MSAPLVTNTSVVLSGLNLYTATKSLTDAQIKALPTTRIALPAAAPGAGKRIVVVKGLWRATTTSGAYTNFNATFAHLRLVYGAGLTTASQSVVNDSGSSQTALTGLLGVASVRSVPIHYWQEVPEVIANVENAVLNVDIDNNGSGVLTGGHASNALVVTVLYVVI